MGSGTALYAETHEHRYRYLTKVTIATNEDRKEKFSSLV